RYFSEDAVGRVCSQLEETPSVRFRTQVQAHSNQAVICRRVGVPGVVMPRVWNEPIHTPAKPRYLNTSSDVSNRIEETRRICREMQDVHGAQVIKNNLRSDALMQPLTPFTLLQPG